MNNNYITKAIVPILQSKITKFLLGVFFISVFLSARSFMGIYILGFRIGELTMGFSMVFYLFSIFATNKLPIFESIEKKKILLVLFFINLIFLINLLFFDESISTYTFRSSSYIWTVGFMFFGFQYFKYNELSDRLPLYTYPVIVYLYFFSIHGLPESVVEFILTISDKFEPHKGSDLLIMYVTIFFINNRLIKNKRLSFEIFFLFSSLYFPLMLFKSRASVIAFCLFCLFELYYFRTCITSSLKRNTLLFLLSVFTIFQSVFFVSGSGFIKAEKIESEVEYVATYRSDPDDEKFRLFYIAEDNLGSRTTRIFSSDNNLNWRLQIWQDVIYDLFNKGKLATGYGHDEKIPAMEDPTRKGQDGLNENTHNYIISLLARGGLLTVAAFLIFYSLVVKVIRKSTGSNYLIFYIIPILFNSLFDVAMENSHFPLIFYFCIGMFFHKKKLFVNY